MTAIALILIAILVVLLDIYLYIRRASITDRIIEKVTNEMPKQKAIIINPPTPAQEALEEIFKRNDEVGKESHLSDIL